MVHARWQRWAALGGMVLLLGLVAQLPARADGVVRMFYFYSPECSHCQAVAEQVLPAIRERYGTRLEMRMFDAREPRNYEVLVRLEERYGIKEGGLPEAFIGDTVLIGERAMRDSLASTIDLYLAKGGTAFPTDDVPVAMPAQPAATPVPADATIHLAYFYKSGCSECDRVTYDLVLLKSRYPTLKVTAFDIAKSQALSEALGQLAGLPAEKRLVTPAVFVGSDALVGADVTLFKLDDLLQRYRSTGAPPLWEGLMTQSAAESIIERFRSFGVLTVLGAGLIDGLNPCAFATIVFFISYLAFLGRSRKDMLLVGCAFTVGVFATYLLVGLGALRFVQALSGVRVAGRVVYGVMGAACLAFAGLSLRDAWLARQGRPEEMQLRLPRALQKRVHQVIRENTSRTAFVGAAALTGLVVSLLELACTGQVYLPTILFVLGVPQLRLHAASYLVLYNLLFVTPLIVVFVVAAMGTQSARLSGVVQKHTSTVKLLTAAVFALLGLWLLSTVL